MQRLACSVIVFLLSVAALPPAVLAQHATPAADFGVAASTSPVALYDALLETPFPDDLLPEGVAPLEAYEWRDSFDPDLAGAIGGVIFADGDPFGSSPPTAIAYMVYPDASGTQTPLATAAQFGTPATLQIDEEEVSAVFADTGDVVGYFTAIDNVFVYGMVPAGAGDGSEEAAASLTRAGIAHLIDLAATGPGAGDVADATPISGAARTGEDAFTAVAAASFPADEIPFEVGSLVVLPMDVSGGDTPSDLVGALLVRDSERIYSYPLVFYRFFADESAALDDVSATVRAAGMSAVAELPSDIEIPYPTTIIDHPNDTTTVQVQVGSTIVIGNAPQGNLQERHETAMTLAQIAVRHLEEVVGTGSVAGAESAAGAGDEAPARLYEALLAATFPEALLPEGVGPLKTSPWQDASDPDLAGSLGGVTYSTGDLLSTQSVSTISMVVYPERTAAEQSLASAVSFVESLDETPRPCAGVEAPSVVYEVAIMHVCFAQLDNVAISGMVLTFDDRPAEEKAAQATALAKAGIAFLEQMVTQS